MTEATMGPERVVRLWLDPNADLEKFVTHAEGKGYRRAQDFPRTRYETRLLSFLRDDGVEIGWEQDHEFVVQYLWIKAPDGGPEGCEDQVRGELSKVFPLWDEKADRATVVSKTADPVERLRAIRRWTVKTDVDKSRDPDLIQALALLAKDSNIVVRIALSELCYLAIERHASEIVALADERLANDPDLEGNWSNLKNAASKATS